MPEINPYILIIMIAIGAGYTAYEKAKEPVKHAIVKVEHGLKHVVTFGKK